MIKKLCLVLLALFALNIEAQEGTVSPYSFYGIGSLKFKGTVENRSMGGLSIYTDSIHLNLRNPASYAGNNLKTYNEESRAVKFGVGGQYSRTNLKTSQGSDTANSTTFDYLALSIPVGKFGIGFGLLPYTSVGYKLESDIEVNSETLLGNQYKGEGGVNKVFFSLAYQLRKDLSIGVDASYNFGKITNSLIEFSYDDDGNLLAYQSRETNTSELSGLNFNIGLSYKPMITDKLQLVSGVTYAPKSNIVSRNQRIFSTIVISSLGQEVVVNEIEADLASQNLDETELTLPSKTAIGVGIGEPRKWFVGTEYTFLKTSDFSNRLFDANPNSRFEDAASMALGGFYIPKYTSFNKYWKRMTYRAGIRYQNSGLKINDESVNEFGISFGVGLPIGKVFSNANLGFEFGKRGTTNQNLVQENFFNFQLSLSLNDRWFVKRKFN
ncbi:MAG: hypothetical protein HRT67_11240 [Flavobacteriaceae bacterium]|nr:hypothetical protein [Flavobacteriaceae bacterium]